MKVIFKFLFFLPSFLFGQEFKNVNLLDQWSDNDLITSSTLVRYNECWGFILENQEYAVLGSTEGTHVFEISNENKLIDKGFIAGKFSSAQVVHRDFKTYLNYLYAVCDEGNSSLQIIDLSYLPDSIHLANEIDDLIGRAHNLFVDSSNALLYAFSVTPTLGGQLQTPEAMRVFSLADPLNPQLLYSGPNDIAEVHDGYVKNNIAILNCGVDGIRRYDFSNPASPIFLQNIPFYQDQGYNHQGWLNPKGDTYIFGDETTGKKLKKCTVATNGELQIESFFGVGSSEGSIPHNIMLDNHFAFVAYYNYGLRIFDYTKTPVEQVAFFDTYPDNKTYQMNGAWGVYSDLLSGRILVSDRTYGLFLFDFDRMKFINRTAEKIQVYPNPVISGDPINFFFNSSFSGPLKYEVFDNLGKRLISGQVTDFNYAEIPMLVSAGKYLLRISYEKNLDEMVDQFPIVVY